MDEEHLPRRMWNVVISGTYSGVIDAGEWKERVRDKSHSNERILTIPMEYRKAVEEMDNPPSLVITPKETFVSESQNE